MKSSLSRSVINTSNIWVNVNHSRNMRMLLDDTTLTNSSLCTVDNHITDLLTNYVTSIISTMTADSIKMWYNQFHTHQQFFIQFNVICALFLTTCEAVWYISLVMSVCLSACMYVCLSDDNFRSLNIGSSYLHMRCIFTDYRSSSYTKVIGSRSRSQETKSLKINIPAM